MDIFFYEVFEEEATDLRSMLGNRFSYQLTGQTIQEAGHAEPPARLISIRTQSTIPPAWAPMLSAVLSRSTGYDHLIAYRSQVRHCPALGYLEEYATRAVAEHAILLAMTLLRKLPQQVLQFSAFNRDGLTGRECTGRNLLVVGVGRIGGEVTRLGQALGFNVRGVDIVPGKANVEYVSREEGLRWADVVICAMNLTDENAGYFSRKTLRLAKHGVLFVNIARGEHAPLEDLVSLLEEGHIGGVGLDVFEEEGPLAATLRSEAQGDSLASVGHVRRLLHFPNVILTPHNAFNTEEAVQRKAKMSFDQIETFLRSGRFLWQL